MNAPGQAPLNLAQRLRTVKVGLRRELEVSRHIFKGKPAYVVRDPITFQTHQLSNEDYQVFVAINSDEQLGQTFERLCLEGTLDDEHQDDFYRFILHLNQLGLLHLPVSDGSALYARFRKRRAAELKAKLLGFLFLRVPLIQPDAFLGRTVRWFAPLFTTPALILWLVGVVISGGLILARWEEFRSPLGTILAMQNLPALWSLLIILKVFHEFGHAYACKHFGGRVPEIGAYFIVFTPCAYVDASASWGFPNRLHRIIVGLGGMYFESIVAMVAVLIWSMTSPGMMHSVAQYTVILSTVITIGFNANPLMKYDGYYILSDLLGTPSLRSDAQRALTTSLKRVLFGIDEPCRIESSSTRILMIAFGIACSLYKTVVVLGISLMIAFKVPALGIGMAVFFVSSTLWQLARKMALFITSLEDRAIRRRAVVVMSLLATSAAAILMFVPVSRTTRALGVLGRRQQQVVRATSSGFLSETRVRDGQLVSNGGVICQLDDIETITAVERKDAELTQLQIQLQRLLSEDLQAAATSAENIQLARMEMEQLQQERDRLTVCALSSGTITQTKPLRDIGRYVREGEPLAILSNGSWVVKAMLTAEDLSGAQPKAGDTVRVCFVGDARREFTGRIIQVAKAGSRLIAEEALTHVGGGEIPVKAETMQAEQPYFEITVKLHQADDSLFRQGLTAWVQFNAQKTPVGLFLYRRGLNILNQLRLAG